MTGMTCAMEEIFIKVSEIQNQLLFPLVWAMKLESFELDISDLYLHIRKERVLVLANDIVLRELDFDNAKRNAKQRDFAVIECYFEDNNHWLTTEVYHDIKRTCEDLLNPPSEDQLLWWPVAGVTRVSGHNIYVDLESSINDYTVKWLSAPQEPMELKFLKTKDSSDLMQRKLFYKEDAWILK